MAFFLKETQLNDAIGYIIERAETRLILMCPYIKLHERIKRLLTPKKELNNLNIIVVIGKNENEISKSISSDDIAFFKDFPNIEIRHNKDLHAKYYANDFNGIITSMNLYDYSINHNIEFGVITEVKGFWGGVINKESLDGNAYSYALQVIKSSDLIFHKTPNFEKSKIPFKKDKYLGSTIIVDNTDSIFAQKKEYKPKRQAKPQQGYCIRTGVEILFNPKKPMTLEAYKSWERYKNPDYKEKFCHKTGKKSYGKTSMSHPIL